MMNEALEAATRLCLDSNLVIYLVERDDELHDKAALVFRQAIVGDKPVVISEVGVAECLYGAFRLQSQELEAKYREFFFDLPLVNLVPVDGAQLIAAAQVGAEKALKLVDAVHFQTAVQSGCDVFVTNDQRFRSSHGVSVVQLRDI